MQKVVNGRTARSNQASEDDDICVNVPQQLRRTRMQPAEREHWNRQIDGGNKANDQDDARANAGQNQPRLS
ncbi:hypothetical protein AMS66_12135 [Paenibacillus xylanivorans]|uniref:Uncharacterized protein n=1 Tax=Paenibacillus xylanivorans TaxID=1705561 RepID=A0A0N0UI34_9BACL|nr:hypothetical protein AMS66_12135 [Paenibacillus xylanivorans]